MSLPTALVVEDQFVIAMELEHRLSQLGFLVLGHAATGELAIAKALENPPDVVLIDIQLAGRLDGIEAAHQIQNAAVRALKIVFVTANSDAATRERAATVRESSYLSKPFSEESLRAALGL